jgi:hypothetical protein
MKKSLVYRVPSATYTYPRGDKYLYLSFVDRPTIIKYKVRNKIGKKLLARVKKYGFEKVTYPV